MKRIGVLALQGAFAEHRRMLERLGAETFEIRSPEDLPRGDWGLVLPGGESTVQGKLLRELGLFGPLADRIAAGAPVLATCAGLVLLAAKVEGGSTHFGLLDAEVRRNAYGRQLGSFTAEGSACGRSVPLVFVRAPAIKRHWGRAQPLAELRGDCVALRQGSVFAAAFHPELADDPWLHSLFLESL